MEFLAGYSSEEDEIIPSKIPKTTASKGLFSSVPKLSIAPKGLKIKSKNPLLNLEAIRAENPELFEKKTVDRDVLKEEIKVQHGVGLSWLPAPKIEAKPGILKNSKEENEKEARLKEEMAQKEAKIMQSVVEEPVYYHESAMYNLADPENSMFAVHSLHQEDLENVDDASKHVGVNETQFEDGAAKLFRQEYSSANNRVYDINHAELFSKIKGEAPLPQPTCVNKRRHHISELVENAEILETEIKMAAAQRIASKRQAAKRYGW